MKLCVTHCGAGKNSGVLAPQEMYKASRIQRFVQWCGSHSFPWAILSAKYGLFFPDEKKSDYNVTLNRRQQNVGYFLNIRVVKDNKPLGREESKNHITALAEAIREQLRARGISQVTLWIEGRRPDAYIALLHYAVDDCDSMPVGKANLEPHLQDCPRSRRMKLVRQLQMVDC